MAQVCWIRRASLAFGSTVEAVSSVLAVFFLGLALGSIAFGERARRLMHPLRVYVMVEIAIALLVIASLPLFDVAAAVFGEVYRAAGPSAVATTFARIGLVAAVLLPPTLLMGGTLPLFCRQFIVSDRRVGRTTALLYGINTLGAAVGAALCGFVLLPAVGMRRAILLATALQGAAAALVAMTGWQRTAPETTSPADAPRRTKSRTATTGVVALVFFCTGFVALGNEVVWTRFLALVLRTTVLTYPICLTVVLIGIVIGSWLAGTMADRVGGRARALAALQIANGFAVLGLLLLPPALWRAAESWTYILLLPAAMLSGAAFPLAVRMVVEHPAMAAAGVGRMTAVNTLGGIAGSLLIGYVVLPQFGLDVSVRLTAGIAVASGCLALWSIDREQRVWLAASVTGACALGWVILPILLGTRLPQDYLSAPAALVDFREGRESNLAVVRRNDDLVLEADRWWQGQDRKTHQVLAAHVPMLLHPAPRRALVVGIGAGQTPARLLLYDVDRVDCVDIEPAVFDLVRSRFDGAWMDDPRVRLLPEDGRSFIAHSDARYDVIALELGQLFRPGVASFYTLDFYRDVQARLAPGGIVAQFVPLPFLSPATFRSVIATFLTVFPQSMLWYNTAELLLLGTNSEHIAVSADRLSLLSADAGVHEDLRYSPWGGPAFWLNQPAVFLGGFLLGPSGLAALAAGAAIETDDRPSLAYASRNVRELDANELAIVDILRPRLEPFAGVLRGDVPEAMLRAAARVRDLNLADVVASTTLRQVDGLVGQRRYDELAAVLRQAQAANPENVQAQRLTGDVALYRNRPADAARAYSNALTHAPADPRSHLGLARALQLQNRSAEAVQHYEVWLAENPRDAEAHNNLAAALAATGDRNGAERHFALAVEIDPDFAAARANLARLRAAR